MGRSNPEQKLEVQTEGSHGASGAADTESEARALECSGLVGGRGPRDPLMLYTRNDGHNIVNQLCESE